MGDRAIQNRCLHHNSILGQIAHGMFSDIAGASSNIEERKRMRVVLLSHSAQHFRYAAEAAEMLIESAKVEQAPANLFGSAKIFVEEFGDDDSLHL
jgi:methyltransferase-like protein